MRALIIKVSALGDTAMTLPAVSAIRRLDPGAQITWVCSKAGSQLVRLLGPIEVITLDELRLKKGSISERLLELGKAWRALFGRRFELVIVGHSSPMFRLLCLTSSHAQWRALSRKKGRLWPIPGRYHGDEYARLVTDIDGPEAEPAELPVLKLNLSDALMLSLGGATHDVIALAPGGAKNCINDQPLRRWPLSSYRLLARALLDRGFRVAVTGNESDEWVREGFEGLPILDLVRRTSPDDLLSLYGHCAAVVTHDSGPLHLALLAGARIVALFGPTDPGEKIPCVDNVRVIWGGERLPCRPCCDGVSYAHCFDNRCLKQISVEAVLRRLKELGVGSMSGVEYRPGREAE